MTYNVIFVMYSIINVNVVTSTMKFGTKGQKSEKLTATSEQSPEHSLYLISTFGKTKIARADISICFLHIRLGFIKVVSEEKTS